MRSGSRHTSISTPLIQCAILKGRHAWHSCALLRRRRVAILSEWKHRCICFEDFPEGWGKAMHTALSNHSVPFCALAHCCTCERIVRSRRPQQKLGSRLTSIRIRMLLHCRLRKHQPISFSFFIICYSRLNPDQAHHFNVPMYEDAAI